MFVLAPALAADTGMRPSIELNIWLVRLVIMGANCSGAIPIAVRLESGLQAHELADVRDQRSHVEDHGARAAVLVALAVDLQPHVQGLSVGYLVARHQPGAQRAEGVAALALVPLSAALQLVGAFGDVVDDAKAGDMVQRIGFGDITRGLADDDAEFDLPVDLLRARRDLDVVVRTDDRTRGLQKEHRLGRYRHVRLSGMVQVVQANAHHLPDTTNAGPEAMTTMDDR